VYDSRKVVVRGGDVVVGAAHSQSATRLFAGSRRQRASVVTLHSPLLPSFHSQYSRNYLSKHARQLSHEFV
jgi:hypothetical protein